MWMHWEMCCTGGCDACGEGEGDEIMILRRTAILTMSSLSSSCPHQSHPITHHPSPFTHATIITITPGRWPEKSVKFMTRLLKNAESNADAKGLDIEDLIIQSIGVQQAPVSIHLSV